MDEMRLHKSRPKLAGQIGICLVLALICLGLVLRDDEPLARHPAGLSGALVFAVFAGLGVRDWIRHAPLLVLDRQGISGPGLGSIGFVPWRAVERVAVADRRGRAVLLAVDEKRLDAAARARMRLDGARNADGLLSTLIKVRDLPLGAPALATLIAERARAAEAAA